ncbi:unnamed protein product [Ostreobium quekettii]|uniref:AAA+ ATPase domain-containing protein n=1 Tax=Ostreobium quekettii TaxID=121088 RepID=A0A8S1JGE7_9CHLO|nr:unnamed protein product [Ostreobium quekettii]
MAQRARRMSERYALRDKKVRNMAESEDEDLRGMAPRRTTTRRTVRKVYRDAQGVRTEHEENEVVVERRERSSKRRRKMTHRYSPGEEDRMADWGREEQQVDVDEDEILERRHHSPTSEQSGDLSESENTEAIESEMQAASGTSGDSEDTGEEQESEEDQETQKRYSLRSRPSGHDRSGMPSCNGRDQKRRGNGSDYRLRPQKHITKYFEGNNTVRADKDDYLEVDEGVDCDDCEVPDVDIVPDTVGLNAIKATASGSCLPSVERGPKLHKNKMPVWGRGGAGAPDVGPIEVDPSLTFNDVGGMDDCITQLKEITFLPLIYPELFQQFNITPPRGILFHGAPGTGKTLMAKVLAAEASRGGRKVTFFMRKGADVLTKWVGESERALRALFEEAKKCQPSIIFFDEIDGLAPARSGRMDHVHNSLVATLLALMDGLESRGEVIVIGATNRVDAIDDALKRPGRFDRLYRFSLPDATARRKILKINTRQWATPPDPAVVGELVSLTAGYCGADLKAVCTEAFFVAVRRTFPQVYESRQKLLLASSKVRVTRADFLAALSAVTPSATTSGANFARPMNPLLAPCLSEHVCDVLDKIRTVFPVAELCIMDGGTPPEPVGRSEAAGFACFKAPGSLLICGQRGCMQHVVGAAVLHKLERLPVMNLGMTDLLTAGGMFLEEALLNKIKEARRCAPSILYLPDFHVWCRSASHSLKSVLEVTCKYHLSAPVLVLAVAEGPAADMMPLFRNFVGDVPQYVGCCLPQVLEVHRPNEGQRKQFFQGIVQEAAKPPEPQPATLRGPPPNLPVDRSALQRDAEAMLREEEKAIREMRMALREVTNTLMADASFHIFIETDDQLEDMEAWENSEAPPGFYKLLENVNDNKYRNPQTYLKDVDGLVRLALQRIKERDGRAELVKSKDLGQRVKDTARLLVESKISPSLITKCNSLVAKLDAPEEEVQGSPNDKRCNGPAATTGEDASCSESPLQEDEGAHERRVSTRRTGRTLSRSVVYDDPEVAMRKLRSLAREKGQGDLLRSSAGCGAMAEDEREQTPPEPRSHNGCLDREDGSSGPSQDTCSAPPPAPERQAKQEDLATAEVVSQRLAKATEDFSLDQLLLLHSKIARKVASSQGAVDRGAVLNSIAEQCLQVRRMGSNWTSLDDH